MPLNILVIGAGVASPFFATLLQRNSCKHTITIIERSPALRAAGQQIDIKTQGIPLLTKLGLLERIRPLCVDENGLEFVGDDGKPFAFFGVGNAKKKRQFTLTSEYEIMRGDLVKLLWEESLENSKDLSEEEHRRNGGVRYEFGKTVTELVQKSDADRESVDVTFSDGQTKNYDLVVGADGQGSHTRRLVFGKRISEESFHELGLWTAFFSIPRIPNSREGTFARAYPTADGRSIFTRPGKDSSMTQVYIFTRNASDLANLKAVPNGDVYQQKLALMKTLDEVGWQKERLVSGLRDCEDFWGAEMGQVKMQSLHKGRVVLLGDAGYCPSPFTGMGTTLSFIGAYTLAGELARHPDDIETALKLHEERMQAPVKECHGLIHPAILKAFFPESALGLWIVKTCLWFISTLRIAQFVSWLMPEGTGGWDVPGYAELGVEKLN
jgi:2-polyprenyl-6-methoxyphenol hydroxylase-like FAD-dependent oxidoreductase